ncbi:LOW QUALITY PROTEIN: Hypothetical protein PHPALM_4233 [Phytophthora palmivora]|uniref:HAT C-terminal dimerisation domain-containing protein n=1 Tax=Phytophthora palmivora TaxID=4796 RepID=A0A2P4YKD5_9STRA|nr:LOW QUALITY PROTEIN: Hypothetical protein PHPALM_4233 [Phytophthora palmivora]
MTKTLKRTSSRHDGLAIAEQMEAVLEQLLSSGWKVGAVVTDNAGQCGRARRILALRYPDIAFVFCFAHDVNNLVKSILKTVFKDISEDAAGIASILNTSKWLVRAVECMAKRYGESFAIFTLCETRWNSMQACFASLLRSRSALEDLASNSEFWILLTSAERIVRPLCAVSFRLQQDENTVADVVISYLEIYRSFAATEFSNALVDCVEARWNACEQPLFILGYYLHPNFVAEARELPLTVLTDLDDVCQFALYYYRRFIGTDDSGLRGDMFAWIEGTFTTSRPSDFNTDVEYEKKAKPKSKLPALALTVLAIAVNTATCERLFSELALIHTPKRNKMTVEKPMKHQIMWQYVRKKNRREKVMPSSSKKLLRTINPKERPLVATPQQSVRATPASHMASPLEPLEIDFKENM